LPIHRSESLGAAKRTKAGRRDGVGDADDTPALPRHVVFEKLLKGQRMLIKELQDLKREVLRLREELERLKEELLTARIEELRQTVH